MNDIFEISKDEFQSIINVKIDTVLEGFNNFESITLNIDSALSTCEKETLIFNFVESLYLKSDTYIDFYLNTLSIEEYTSLLNKLSEEDKFILAALKEENYTSIYFKVSSIELLKFFVRLSTRELFFVTLYFKDIDITVWSNYNFNFLIFYSTPSSLDLLKSICNTNCTSYY